MTIERSTGIPVAGWAGPLPGGGYRGATPELDALVEELAEWLRILYAVDIQIRFNADRRSGGAFLADEKRFGVVGVGAGIRNGELFYKTLCRVLPDKEDHYREHESVEAARAWLATNFTKEVPR